MKASIGRNVTLGGPGLAAQALRAALVDECHLFVTPIVVGGGKQSLPDEVRWELELLGGRRFEDGVAPALPPEESAIVSGHIFKKSNTPYAKYAGQTSA